jgi:leader peptidase (prepilin peptidase)/N-methyltransferase
MSDFLHHLDTAAVCAVLGGVSGWFVPRLVAAVPEPEPAPDGERPAASGATRAPAKVPYAEIARAPGLGWGSAVVAALVAGVFGLTLGWVWPLVYLLPAVPLGVALAVIDWRTRLLPTWYLAPSYPALVLLVVACGAITRDWDDLVRAGLGWLVMGGFYYLSYRVTPKMMGYGDVRLAGLLGMALGYLGWGQLVVGMYVAFLVFGLPPLLLAVLRRDRSILRLKMPFGPAMLFSGATGVVLGAPIADWYLRSIGAA